MQRGRQLWWARQRVLLARARAPRDAAVQYYLESTSALSIRILSSRGVLGGVVQFEGVLPEAAPCVLFAPVELDGQVGIMVDFPHEVYELVRLVVHLAGCLYVKYGGGLRHPPCA